MLMLANCSCARVSGGGLSANSANDKHNNNEELDILQCNIVAFSLSSPSAIAKVDHMRIKFAVGAKFVICATGPRPRAH